MRRLEGGGATERLERAAWLVQVYSRTIRRWSASPRSQSAIPYPAWCLLSVVGGDVPPSTLGTLIAGGPLLEAEDGRLRQDARATLETRLLAASRAAACRERWRPTTELVADVVAPYGLRVAERGVQQVAEGLRVDQSTVWRWIDRSRERSAIPYTAWTLLLVRDRMLLPDRRVGVRLSPTAARSPRRVRREGGELELP